MKIHRLVTGAFQENCYFAEMEGGTVVIVDPGADAKRIIEVIKNNKWTVGAILLTHGHIDHISALPELAKEYPEIKIHMAPGDREMAFSVYNAIPPYEPITEVPIEYDACDGRELFLWGEIFRVIATPGHSKGSVCWFVQQAGEPPVLFSGDTLFRGTIGRTDFNGSDPAEMEKSLEKLSHLASETRVFPGHGLSTSIGMEKSSNPWMQI